MEKQQEGRKQPQLGKAVSMATPPLKDGCLFLRARWDGPLVPSHLREDEGPEGADYGVLHIWPLS